MRYPTAAEPRDEVTLDDLRAVAPMALRLRRSQLMNEYFKDRKGEEQEVGALLGRLGKQGSKARSANKR